MSAVLKSITPNAENLIVDNARVSNPNNRGNTETAPRLIKYLINHEHWSPFEMANMSIEITTSRAISAQILRHRSFCFQEYSQRYAEVPPPPIPELRSQDPKNRQSSHDDLPLETKRVFEKKIQELFLQTDILYRDMLLAGVAKECARMIMPMCSETTLIINGNIRSWMFYLKLRTKDDVQLEHRRIALLCLGIFKQQLPNVYEAFFAQ